MRGRARLTIVLLLLAACGRDSTAPSVNIVSSAVDAAHDQETFRWDMVVSWRLPGGPLSRAGTEPPRATNSILFRAKGLGDFADERFAAEMNIEASNEALRDSALPAGAFETCRTRSQGQSVYLSVPSDKRPAYGGHPWVKVEDEEEANAGPFSSNDPGEMLDFLLRTASSVQEVGQEPVRGVPTTRFRVTTDVEKMIAELPEDEREEARRSSPDTTSVAPFEIWIDDERLPRRLTYKDDGSADARGFGSTTEFFGYGEPVDIDIPPPNAVSTIRDAGLAFSLCLGVDTTTRRTPFSETSPR